MSVVPPSSWSTVRLFRNSQIANDPPYVCDGSLTESCCFDIDQKIELVGIGFLGPLDADANYDVRILPQLWKSKRDLPFALSTKIVPTEDRKANLAGPSKFVIPSTSNWAKFGFTSETEEEIKFIVSRPQLGGKKYRSACGLFAKRIHAKKGQVFHFIFDEPIIINPDQKEINSDLIICSSVKGPNTSSLKLGSCEYSHFETKHDGVTFTCYSRSTPIVELLFNKL